MSQRTKPSDLYETQELFREDEIEEYIKFHPSKAEVEIGEVYFSIKETLDVE